MLDHVIPNGTKVRTVIGNIEGITVGIMIEGKHIETATIAYKVNYFLNGSLQREWLEAYEIEVVKDNRQPAGFTSNSQKLLK